MSTRRTGTTRGNLLASSALTVCGVLSLLTSGAVPPAAAQSAPVSRPAVTWEACPEIVGIPGAQCGRTDAPKRAEDPTGERISVGFVRLPATGARRGTIFYNPGGPGGSAYAYVGSALQWPEAVRAHYDIVGIQPRGMTGSTPLPCVEQLTADSAADDATQASTTLTEADVEAFLQPGKAMRAECGWDDVSTLTTANLASDWEAVRRSLGLNTVNAAGMSYGTILASTYATLYPQHTDKVILDSGIDPHAMWTTAFLAQPPVYLDNLNRFFRWVADNDATYHLGTTPLQVYNAWARRIADETGTPPSMAPPAAEGEEIPAGVPPQLFNAYLRASTSWSNLIHREGSQANSLTLILTRMAVPSTSSWPFVASLVSGQIADFNPEKVEEMLSTDESLVDMAAVGVLMQCNENQVPPKPELIGPFAWETLITQNVFWMGAYALGSGLQCAGAPPVARVPELSGANLQVRPLEIQGTHDPQTPFHLWGGLAQAMNSQVIVVEGWDHGYFAVGNANIDAAVAHYLDTGEVPDTAMEVPLPAPRVVTTLREAL
ncbi:MAG: alpha/beta fold hydrolase [Corynebacterium sp.]|nr:alpha/beta fold hydrolase [Corynebacterium sp.]